MNNSVDEPLPDLVMPKQRRVIVPANFKDLNGRKGSGLIQKIQNDP
jgi:hypothetical protein